MNIECIPTDQSFDQNDKTKLSFRFTRELSDPQYTSINITSVQITGGSGPTGGNPATIVKTNLPIMDYLIESPIIDPLNGLNGSIETPNLVEIESNDAVVKNYTVQVVFEAISTNGIDTVNGLNVISEN